MGNPLETLGEGVVPGAAAHGNPRNPNRHHEWHPQWGQTRLHARGSPELMYL
jgi:hypothetical protein